MAFIKVVRDIALALVLLGGSCLPACDTDGGPCEPEFVPISTGHYEGGCNRDPSIFPFCKSWHTLDLDMEKRVAVFRYERGGHVYEETWLLYRLGEDPPDDATVDAWIHNAWPQGEADAGPDVGLDVGPDVGPDISPDVPPDVPQDVHHDVGTDTRSDVAPDAGDADGA